MDAIPQLRFLFFFAALFICSTAFSQEQNPLAGRKYLELSELKEMRGYVTYGGCVVGPGPDYNHTIGVYTNGINTVIVLERTYNPGNDIRYSVLDTVNLGPIDPMNHISFYDCELNGTEDNAIIAVHDDQPGGDYYTKIRKAWTADLNTLKLVPVPDIQLKMIRCPQPGEEEFEDNMPMQPLEEEIPAEVYNSEGHAGNVAYPGMSRKELKKQKKQLKKALRKAGTH